MRANKRENKKLKFTKNIRQELNEKTNTAKAECEDKYGKS